MNPLRCSSRSLVKFVIATAALLGATLLSSAEEKLKVEGKTVELPEFTVVDSRVLPETEPWTYARVGRFDVLSAAGEGATRKLVGEFMKFQQAMSLVWPVPPKQMASSSLIICGKDAQFAPFVPDAAKADSEAINSRFLRDHEIQAIIVNFGAKRALVNDPTVSATLDAGTIELEIDHATLLYREYIFSLLNQSEVRPPAWMAEGLAQIVMDAEITDRALIYGKVVTTKGAAVGGGVQGAEETDASANLSAVVGEQPFNVVLQHKRLIPLPEFFAVTADSKEAKSALGNTLWAKQAYLFLHFCMFGEDLRHRDHLTNFVTRLAREPLTEELFRDCFRVSYAQMEQELYTYLLGVRHKYQRYEFKSTDQFDPKSIAFAPASQGQIGLILGDAHRLAGRTELALNTYRAGYLRGGRDPALLVGLSLAEEAAGNSERATKFLDAACAANVPRPSAYLLQARRRLAAALAKPAGPEGKIDPAQLGGVLQAVFSARRFPPPVAETYELAAAAWAASAVAPKPANLSVLDEGVRAFPRRSDFVLTTAKLYASIGAKDTAVAIAKVGLRFATDAEAKRKFQALIEQAQ